jgi:prepilin-type N-terminal cleavage/methylation domain-containing protein
MSPRVCGQVAFSLVELVLVVAIIGILAGIAVPRISQAGKNAEAKAVQATLANVRNAIDRYYAEHGKYPGYNSSTGAPNGAFFVNQLTQYTNAKGRVAAMPTGAYKFGPYLGKPFPTNPFNGLSNVKVREDRTGVFALGSSGWVATLSDGTFTINTDADLLPVDVFAPEERADISGALSK